MSWNLPPGTTQAHIDAEVMEMSEYTCFGCGADLHEEDETGFCEHCLAEQARLESEQQCALCAEPATGLCGSCDILVCDEHTIEEDDLEDLVCPFCVTGVA